MCKILSIVGKQLVINHFGLQNLAVHLGASLEKIEHGFVEIKLPKHPLVFQHHNNFHGGIISYLADISGGLAGISVLKDINHSSTTIELKMNFLKPATG